MCGRFVSRHTSQDLLAVVAAYLDVDPTLGEDLHLWPRRSNVAPTSLIRVAARPESDGGVRLVAMRWGLVTPWAARTASPRPLINARAETVGEKPSFREAFARRRCLVIMDGFYEWTAVPGSTRRQPHYLSAASGGPLTVGGVWNPAGSDQPASVALITTAANADVEAIHDRMPVILAAEDWTTWMDHSPDAVAAVHSLLRPAPSGTLQSWVVDSAVNSARVDGDGLTDPVARASDDLGASHAPQLFADGLGG